MTLARIIIGICCTTALVACKSAPDPAGTDDPSYPNSRDEAAYPETGPPLRPCPDQTSASGQLCRLTRVGAGEVRIRVHFPDSTRVDSSEPVPADLIRFRFLGRLEGFAACLIPTARNGWTGTSDTAIKATLVGSTFEHVTMAPDGLPESATACFQALTQRLRVKRAPGADARVTQPVVVQLDAVDS